MKGGFTMTRVNPYHPADPLFRRWDQLMNEGRTDEAEELAMFSPPELLGASDEDGRPWGMSQEEWDFASDGDDPVSEDFGYLEPHPDQEDPYPEF